MFWKSNLWGTHILTFYGRNMFWTPMIKMKRKCLQRSKLILQMTINHQLQTSIALFTMRIGGRKVTIGNRSILNRGVLIFDGRNTFLATLMIFLKRNWSPLANGDWLLYTKGMSSLWVDITFDHWSTFWPVGIWYCWGAA